MIFDPLYKAVWQTKIAITKCSLLQKKFFMKKIIAFLLLGSGLTVAIYSCKPAETKKEVVVVPSTPVVIVKDPPEKGTTITVDKNGVKVEAKKVGVVVKKQ